MAISKPLVLLTRAWLLNWQFWLGLLFLVTQVNTALAGNDKTLSAEFKTASEAYAKQDYQTAHQLFSPMAQQGNVFAQFALGKMYRFGQGRMPDYAQAFAWYQKAAQQNYAVAQSHFGEMYEQGLGVEKNLSMAKNWYQVACANKCSQGCQHLSRLEANDG